ncbi:MAG TPA: bifunctional 4-hydroxy-2-oxoglutarate aldolase/2-dehydro-3-deoxy-phosphogluconate aldolase [Actinocrinis sp.]|nr:bifunctional 4-hydroxy-2-oxoglutarate aldolase/2-dehydro-3-deoxy-phosphogluconate aldolase [Actinocrinis sp.]
MTQPTITDPTDLLSILEQDRALVIVRAKQIADPAALARALAAGGIRLVEFTFTTPTVLDVIKTCAEVPETVVGAGTVLTAEQAEQAIGAGARFLVTPDLRPQVAEVARRTGTPLFMGALTPTEVSAAVELGAAAVKIFPAGLGGPGHLRALLGPFPDLRLVPTGGVNAGNARTFLDAGAFAVGAGSDVVVPDLVERGEHGEITRRAADFVRALKEPAA